MCGNGTGGVTKLSTKSGEGHRQMIFEYIEVFYNRRRLHSTLDYQSPAAYKEVRKTTAGSI
jgi:transposase InsO family protein